MQKGKSLDPSEQYVLDECQRIRPVNQMGWSREAWKDTATFEEAIDEISVSIHVKSTFPTEPWTIIPIEEWRDLKAKHWLDLEDAFYLVTGVDVRHALFRFEWGEDQFFNFRPDFCFLSLTTDLGEMPINSVESVIRDKLIDHYRETGALKRAINATELDPYKLYSIEWWQNFWAVRGIETPGIEVSHAEKAERFVGKTGQRLLALLDQFEQQFPGHKENPPALNKQVRPWIDGKTWSRDYQPSREAHVFGVMIAEEFGLKND